MLIKLSNPEATLPWPGVPGRLLKGTETADIDPFHPFWRACLRDGSIVEVPPEAAPEAAPSTASKSLKKE